MERDELLDASPWLYDVASDASDTGTDGEVADELLDGQGGAVKAWMLNGGAMTGPSDEVRCAGATASGVRCTRTTRIPATNKPAADAGDLFCYRHQHQRRQRGAGAHPAKTRRCSRCCCWSEARGGPGRRHTRQHHFWRQFLAVVVLFGCSLAAASAGIARRSVFLCAASAFGLFVFVVGACVIVCLTVSRALPPPANVDKVMELALATFSDTTQEPGSATVQIAESA